MKELLSVIFTLTVSLQVGFAQKGLSASQREFQKNAAEVRKETTNAATANLVPADFNDTASFGKNTKFLGSL